MLYIITPENLYPQLPTAPPISQESFNIEMVRKYYQDIANLKEKYTEKQQKYKNAYNRLLHASTDASTVGVVSGVSTIGTAFTVVGLPITASLGVVSTVSTCVGACLLLTSKKYKKKLLRQVLFDIRAGNSNLAKSLGEKSNHAMYQDQNPHRRLLSFQN